MTSFFFRVPLRFLQLAANKAHKALLFRHTYWTREKSRHV